MNSKELKFKNPFRENASDIIGVVETKLCKERRFHLFCPLVMIARREGEDKRGREF